MRPHGVGVLHVEVKGEITPDLAGLISRYVDAYPSRSIELTVDSIGGDFAASMIIFTTLRTHRHRVTAQIQRASSGAALVMMGADHRTLDPSGSVFVHWPSGDGASKADLDSCAELKAAAMARYCRVPASKILKWMAAATRLNAQRALDAGLVHDVPGLRRQAVVWL